MNQDSYYNTTRSDGTTRRKYEIKAKSQEEAVLRWFQDESINACGWTPSEIRDIVFANAPPITSVRRAMTNLTDQCKLIKTDNQRKGPEGRPEYVWRFPPQQPEQRNLF